MRTVYMLNEKTRSPTTVRGTRRRGGLMTSYGGIEPARSAARFRLHRPGRTTSATSRRSSSISRTPTIFRGAIADSAHAVGDLTGNFRRTQASSIKRNIYTRHRRPPQRIGSPAEGESLDEQPPDRPLEDIRGFGGRAREHRAPAQPGRSDSRTGACGDSCAAERLGPAQHAALSCVRRHRRRGASRSWSNSQIPLSTADRAGTRSLARSSSSGPTWRTGRLDASFQTPKNGYADSFRHRDRAARELCPGYPLSTRRQDLQERWAGLACQRHGDRCPTASINRVDRQGAAAGRRQRKSPDIFRLQHQPELLHGRARGRVDPQYQPDTIGQFSTVRDPRRSRRPSDRWDGTFVTLSIRRLGSSATYSASSATAPRHAAQISADGRSPGSDAAHRRPSDDGHAHVGDRRSRSRPGRTLGGNVPVQRRREKPGAAQTSGTRFFYNAQCCGFGVDYQITNIEHLNQSETFRRTSTFSFTLAGIGSFSNPMGAFGNNIGRDEHTTD